MLEGKCPKCGACYYGEQLRFPRHQACILCFVGLEITEDGHPVSEGYSPFTAEEYSVDLPSNVPTPSDETKDSTL